MYGQLLNLLDKPKFPEARKLAHLGVSLMPQRSTLSDANARRKDVFFGTTHYILYIRACVKTENREAEPRGTVGKGGGTARLNLAAQRAVYARKDANEGLSALCAVTMLQR